MEREEGYYWVKEGIDDWQVAWWGSKVWWLPLVEKPLDDKYFTEIDERRIINPNENKKHE